MPGYDEYSDELDEQLDYDRDQERERDDIRRDRCPDPARCCCPHVYHGPDECEFHDEDEPVWPHADVPLVPRFEIVDEQWRPE